MMTKTKEDPLSHRVIEKRRRDRMNGCLAELSKLIPAEYTQNNHKKNRGRLEKTEIIEMAIKHIKHLQQHACDRCSTEFQSVNSNFINDEADSINNLEFKNNLEENCRKLENMSNDEEDYYNNVSEEDLYRQGYNDCLSESLQYIVQINATHSTAPHNEQQQFCFELASHLQNRCDTILKERRRFSTHEITNFQVNNVPSTSNNSNHNSINPYTVDKVHAFPRQRSLSFSQIASQDKVESTYKFKDSIRKRFSLQVSGELSSSTRLDKIPAFALSYKGPYYVPLMLNSRNFEEIFDGENWNMENPNNILHPITISVNFQSKFLMNNYENT